MKPWWQETFCIPPEQNASFVCPMEEILDLYHRAYDARYPVLCLEEMPVQLLGECREALPMEAGKVRREDNEYERWGTASLFMVFEPLAGKRLVWVRARRTAYDWAEVMQQVADEYYPDAERIVMVMDNLNTHHFSSLFPCAGGVAFAAAF